MMRTPTRRASLALCLSLTAIAATLTGCAGGVATSTTYAAAGGAVAAVRESQEDFQQELADDYAEYRELFRASRCDPDQYKISKGILEFIWNSPPTEDGFSDAQDILQRIYEDESQPRDVRAHALYTIALIEGEKEESDPEKARRYLRQVKDEFPGTHDCAVNVLLERGHRI